MLCDIFEIQISKLFLLAAKSLFVGYYYIYCHSIFSHLTTCSGNICVYAKMLESSFYKNASKNDTLPQSPSLRGTF